MTLNLTTKQIKAALQFATPDPTRFHLDGLFITGQGSLVVATDGHCLLRLETDKRPGGPDGLVRRDALETACKLAGPSGSVMIVPVSNDAGDVTFTLTPRGKPVGDNPIGPVCGPDVTSHQMQSPFPPWQSVVPAKEAGIKSRHGVNPAYLARMAPLGEVFFKGRAVELVCASGELDPIRYDFSGSDWSGSVVIMPMRL